MESHFNLSSHGRIERAGGVGKRLPGGIMFELESGGGGGVAS